MTAHPLARMVEHSGLTLQLNEGQLTLKGKRTAVDAWAPRLRQFKAELSAALISDASNDPQFKDELEDVALQEAFYERAAILEHDGGLSLPEAEAQAAVEVYSIFLSAWNQEHALQQGQSGATDNDVGAANDE